MDKSDSDGGGIGRVEWRLGATGCGWSGDPSERGQFGAMEGREKGWVGDTLGRPCG